MDYMRVSRKFSAGSKAIMSAVQRLWREDRFQMQYKLDLDPEARRVLELKAFTPDTAETMWRRVLAERVARAFVLADIDERIAIDNMPWDPMFPKSPMDAVLQGMDRIEAKLGSIDDADELHKQQEILSRLDLDKRLLEGLEKRFEEGNVVRVSVPHCRITEVISVRGGRKVSRLVEYQRFEGEINVMLTDSERIALIEWLKCLKPKSNGVYHKIVGDRVMIDTTVDVDVEFAMARMAHELEFEYYNVRDKELSVDA